MCSDNPFDNDVRLGPNTLPTAGAVGQGLKGYKRFGMLDKTAFLAKYYDASASGGKGGWKYPPFEGFVVAFDGKPVKSIKVLRKGEKVDRFGHEYGSYLTPAGTSYTQRALSPAGLNNMDSVNCGYRVYEVKKEFSVEAGKIAPWFEQSGGGMQYKLVASQVNGAPEKLNVIWLVNNGYLDRK
ncbi:hypothetical protein GQ42DRAFT_128450 [Ramicandelaber brevisporus]|nr:hypothetical protein GQ42DRAFT_128450 [Ramicandelaber brevisporus]